MRGVLMPKPQKPKAVDEIEFRADGWKQFEKALDAARERRFEASCQIGTQGES